MTNEERNELKTIAGAMISVAYEEDITTVRDIIEKITDYLCTTLESHNIAAPFGEIKECVIDCIGHILKFPGKTE